uniref:N-acetyltransferase ESCO2 n=1 Tax=Haemonchus contortus TaxID=6289 RepID=W6NHE3_HAECO
MPIFDLTPKQSTKKKPRLSVDDHDSKQTTLNAGQQKIGGQYCKECDMMYSIESLAEVEMHKKHHNRLIDIAGVKVSSSQLSLWLRKERHYDSPHGSIFRIHPDSRSTLKRKVEQVIEDLLPIFQFGVGMREGPCGRQLLARVLHIISLVSS